MSGMDREISQEDQRKVSRAKIFKVVAGIMIVLMGLLGFRWILMPTIDKKDLHTAVAEIGSIEATLSASGVVIPLYEQVITSPVVARIQQVSFFSGDAVEADQSILSLDLEAVLSELEKLQDQQSLKKNTARQLELQLQKNLSDLRNQLEIKKLQIASLESLLKDEIHLKKIGGSTEYNVKTAQLNLEIARKEATLLGKQINNQEELNQVDLRGLSFEINILEKEIQEIARKIERAQVKTQQAGVITWVNEDIGAAVTEGEVLVKVADLSSFKVEGSISDVYADMLNNGGEVIVRINKTDLRGRITNIHPAVENGIITFIVQLQEKSNELLRSNLRVEVFVITSFVDQVVRVKNGPFYNGSVDQKVYVLEGDKAVRRTVTLGASNFDFVELANGIEAGEVVVISNMEEYDHQKEITID